MKSYYLCRIRHSANNKVDASVKRLGGLYWGQDGFLEACTDMALSTITNPKTTLNLIDKRTGKHVVIMSCREDNRKNEVSFRRRRRWHTLSVEDFIKMVLLPRVHRQEARDAEMREAEIERQQSELRHARKVVV